MYALLMIVHLLVCLGLIGVVLVQSGKGGGLAGGAFGGSAQTVFGGRGATDFITRATMVLGALFFVTSLVLARMTTSGGTPGASRSLIQEQAKKAATTAPVQAPGQTPTTPGSTPPSGAAPAPTTPAPTTPAPAPGGGR